MTAVDSVTDAEVLAAHDFEIPCMVRQRLTLNMGNVSIPLPQPKHCTAPADWLATCRTCGRRSYVCDPHRTIALTDAVACCEACQSEGTQDEVFTFAQLPVGGK